MPTALSDADLAIHLSSRRGLRRSMLSLADLAVAEHNRRGLPLLRVRLEPYVTHDKLDWIDLFEPTGLEKLGVAITVALVQRKSNPGVRLQPSCKE